MTKDLIYILSKHENYKGRKYDDYRTVRNISVCKDDTYFSKEDYNICTVSKVILNVSKKLKIQLGDN